MRQPWWFRVLRGGLLILIAIATLLLILFGAAIDLTVGHVIGVAVVMVNVWRFLAPPSDRLFGFRHSALIQFDRFALLALAAYIFALLGPLVLYFPMAGLAIIWLVMFAGASVAGLAVTLWRLSVPTVRARPTITEARDNGGHLGHR